MMKRLSLVVVVATLGLVALALGTSACTLNLPGPADLSAPPPDLSASGGGDMTTPSDDM